MECLCNVENTIDWNTIAAIASAIAAFLALIVSIIVACSQKRQASQEQRISLFDKRYDIYCEFIRIFKFSEFVEQENSYTVSVGKQSNRLYIIDRIAEEYSLLGKRSFSEEYLYYDRVTRESGGADEMRAMNKEHELEEEISEKLRYLRATLNARIKPSEFCYSEKIEKCITEYIEALFAYVIQFHVNEKTEAYVYLKEKIQAITDEKIIDIMRDGLKISRV